jgi:hypothetical protein
MPELIIGDRTGKRTHQQCRRQSIRRVVGVLTPTWRLNNPKPFTKLSCHIGRQEREKKEKNVFQLAFYRLSMTFHQYSPAFIKIQPK